jgi:hypothetical protein
VKDINILIGHTHAFDKELFFGPTDPDEQFRRLPAKTTLPQLLKALGIYDSTSEASRAGYRGAIPEGFSEYRVHRPAQPWKTREISILKCSRRMKPKEWLRLSIDHLSSKLKIAFK